MTRRAALICVLAVAVGLLGACGKPTKTATELRVAIARTERASRAYVYRETAGQEQIEIRGIVEDDFRHKARMALGGRPVVDEVVFDDLLAFRVIDDTILDRFVDGTPLPEEPTAAPPAVAPLDALKTRRWVVDRTGAPLLQAPASGRRFELGEDPLRDAREVLAYVRRAIDSADAVVLFDEDSLEYKPSEDPFPHPKKGEKRYDLVRPDLPNPSATAVGGSALPGPQHVRKLSVYVRAGFVVRVLEQVAPDERLDEMLDDAVVFLRDRGASPQSISKLRAIKGQSDSVAGDILIEVINLFREQQGADPIRARRLSLTFSDIGGAMRVDLPTEFVETDLDLLRNRGREPDGSSASGGSGGAVASAPSTTVTTAVTATP